MATDLIEIDPQEPYSGAVDKAAAMIQRGGVVAIPTDALYALVCDPVSLKAVGRIYEAKGRESTRALPMIVEDILAAEEYAQEITPRFRMLARRFWPGPLTIITKGTAKIPLKVTGNTGRLAMRQPKAEVALKLLAKVGHPLIATSANLSGQPTCASGIEVFGVMDGKVDLVLDGGACRGVGATTVDITEPYWRVLKEGAISEREIADSLHGL